MSDHCIVQISVKGNRNLEKMVSKIQSKVWDACSVKEVIGSRVYYTNVEWKTVEITISELTLGESLDILAKIKIILNISGPYFVVYGLI